MGIMKDNSRSNTHSRKQWAGLNRDRLLLVQLLHRQRSTVITNSRIQLAIAALVDLQIRLVYSILRQSLLSRQNIATMPDEAMSWRSRKETSSSKSRWPTATAFMSAWTRRFISDCSVVNDDDPFYFQVINPVQKSHGMVPRSAFDNIAKQSSSAFTAANVSNGPQYDGGTPSSPSRAYPNKPSNANRRYGPQAQSPPQQSRNPYQQSINRDRIGIYRSDLSDNIVIIIFL